MNGTSGPILRYAGMAKRPLKVFRTSAGFQDAYVATTSQKAALEAWGARTNLFASGIAEQVTDPKLTNIALAQPGKVIRAPRGTTAQHLAAAGKSRARPAKSVPDEEPDAERTRPVRPKRKPKPSRSKLDKAIQALEQQEQEFTDSLADIDRQIDALRQERQRLQSKRDQALTKLEDRRDREDAAYRSALDNWEG